MTEGCVAFVKSLWAVANGPNNEPVVLGLIVALFGMLVAFWKQSRATKEILEEKDRRIADLVRERNKFQEIVLELSGVKRQTTGKGKRP